MRHNATSNTLLSITAVLIVLAVASLLFTHQLVKSIELDAKAINNAGLIRGSLQRLTKLALAEQTEFYRNTDTQIISQVDQYFNFLSDYPNTGVLQARNASWSDNISELSALWDKYKISISRYKKNSSKENQDSLLLISEQAWYAADQTVLRAQLSNESKIGDIYLLYGLIFLSMTIFIGILVILLRNVRNRLELNASIDCITKLPNRNCYEIEMKDAIIRRKKNVSQLSLILFDIDNFKLVNDRFGHNTGDRVLTEVGRVITDMLGTRCTLFRVGGEEFAIICRETSIHQAELLAEKLRCKIEKHAFEAVGNISISFGVSEFEGTGSDIDFYNMADKGLYKAKNSGKNRVVCFQSRPNSRELLTFLRTY